jgi:SAM-dependent methyltransferase
MFCTLVRSLAGPAPGSRPSRSPAPARTRAAAPAALGAGPDTALAIATVLVTTTTPATATAPAAASTAVNDLIRTTSSLPRSARLQGATYGTGSIDEMRMRKGWDAQADNWARFARTPGHDAFYDLLNLPAFLSLLPAPGRRTLDLGCGEGRLSRVLAAAGHTMVATDASPGMIALAASTAPAPAAVLSDAARLPFTDAAFDLVVAFMCLHDMDRMPDAIREAGRVLSPGGRLALAIVHPLNSAGNFTSHEPAAPFVITGSYLDDHPADWTAESGGIQVDFHSHHHPLEAYAAALASAGLLIERLREPKAPPGLIAINPAAARFLRVPVVLHILALRPAS